MANDTTLFKTSRRGVMLGMAGAATFGLPGMARAQSKGRIVVGTWGGDYARLLRKNIDEPLLVPKGWEVIQDIGGDPERRAKMIAERRLPRGSSDIQGLSGINMYQMYDIGTTQEIDYGKIPNAANLMPSMKFKYGAGHIYSGMVGVYNPKLAQEPASYKAVFDPNLGDKLGIIDIQYQYTMVAAALAAGGSVSDLEPGKKLLLEVRKAGARIYPTNEAFAQGLKVEEVAAGIMWKARTVQWQDAGIDVKSATPAEGALAYVSGFVIPKNAPDVAGSYAFLNAMLAPSAQEAFAADMGYNPTVTDAKVAPALKERIGFTEEQVAKLVQLDDAYITAHDVEMKDWWDKKFKG